MNIFQKLGSWIRTLSRCIPATKSDIHKIEMKATEVLVGLQALNTQTEKSRAEVVAAVAGLSANVATLEAKIVELSAGELSPEITAAFDALKASVQAVDDLNADGPVTGGPTV